MNSGGGKYPYPKYYLEFTRVNSVNSIVDFKLNGKEMFCICETQTISYKNSLIDLKYCI